VLHIDLVLGERTIKKRRTVLKDLDRSLHGTFDQTMKRIRDSENAKIGATKILTWVYLAERRLTVGELLHGLAVEEGEDNLDEDNLEDPETFLDCCLGLATIDTETATVGLFHLSLRDYFCAHGIFDGRKRTKRHRPYLPSIYHVSASHA